MTKGCWRNFARWSLIGCQTKENTVSNTWTLSVPRIKHSSSCDATKVDKTLSFLLIDPPRQTELRSSPNMFALHTLAGLQADLVRRDLTNWYGLCTNLFLTSSWFMSVYMYIYIYIYDCKCIYGIDIVENMIKVGGCQIKKPGQQKHSKRIKKVFQNQNNSN